MQRLATKVFIVASLVFGIAGVLAILTSAKDGTILTKLVLVCVFIILPSFALSVAGKYLTDRKPER